MKGFLFSAILFFSFLFSVFSRQSLEKESFQEAIDLYQEGQYSESAVILSGLISEGYGSESLFYNLGNCYAKLEDIPKSILNFERALKLVPFDEDIMHNLNLTKQKIGIEIIEAPDFFLTYYWNSFSYILKPDYWTYLNIVATFAFLFFCCVWLFGKDRSAKKRSFFLALAFILLAIMTFFTARTRYQLEYGQNSAILMSEELYLKSGPDPKSIDLRLLYGGVKVFVTDQIGKWYKVELGNNETGWIEMKNLEII